MKNKLSDLRKHIDRIDADILSLLSRRFRVAGEIGALKHAMGLPIRVPGRERQVLERLKKINPGPMPATSIESIFKTIIQECRSYEANRDHAGARDPFVKNISILGLGLMGGSVALALQKYAPEVQVIGFDPALKAPRGFPVPLARDLGDALNSELVILAMPIQAICNFLVQSGKKLTPGTILLDLGSTKKEICILARRLPAGVVFIGGHPLAGKARGGFWNADSELFSGRPFVLVLPQKRVNKAARTVAETLVRKLGAEPIYLSAEAHDQMLAVTSHLPQLLSTALACTAAQCLGSRRPLHGPAFEDLTRLAASDYRVWRDILLTNKTELKKSVSHYQKCLARLSRAASTGSAKDQFSRAQKYRKKIG